MHRSSLNPNSEERMIKIACNYTTELTNLLDQAECEVDFIKYPSLANDEGFSDYNIYMKNIRDIRKYKPVLYHGSFPANIFIGSKDFIDNFELSAFQEICTATDTHGISLHFAGGDCKMSKEETIETAVENLLYIRSSFPDMSFIAIENLAKTKNPHEQDADVISEIVEKANINFLYDISHAFKYTYDNGIDFHQYVSKLPLHKVHEVHINGWKIKNGDVQAHMCIQEDLYEHIEWIARETPVKIMTLEYGRHNDRLNCGCPIVKIGQSNPDALNEIKYQLDRLNQIIKRQGY